jgi:signal transduction histidine kinase
MWTVQQAQSVLKKQKSQLIKNWQEDVHSRLWHLESALFAKRGTATLCAETLLSLLSDAKTLDGVYPPTHFSLFETMAAFDTSVSSTRPLSTSEIPLQSRDTEVNRAYATCARDWADLPISLIDLRTLLECFNQQILATLEQESADAETLIAFNALVSHLICAVAGLRAYRAERELDAQREEIIATQHLATRFLGNASHELRTPLTAILGFSELLLEGHYGELPPVQQTALSHIDNSAQNLLEIVNNLLDLLHIRTGKLKPHYRSVPLAALLENLYQILLPLSQRKEVVFSLSVDDNIGAIEADENIVRHIVYHVLASSLRATPKGGQVRLSARRDTDQVCIVMEDTALHLPEEALANMMNPFPRLENSPLRGYEGWEVGLPLVMRYVDLHGGNLELKSLPETGTVFLVYLPIKPAHPTPNMEA